MSDDIIAEIERWVDACAEDTGQMCLVYYSGRAWVAACTFLNIRAENLDVMDALREFEKLVRAHLKRESALAQTLGLEAAE